MVPALSESIKISFNVKDQAMTKEYDVIGINCPISYELLTLNSISKVYFKGQF